MIRAKSLAAILDASEKVNRAFRAGALAVGARIEIKDRPVYLPILAHAPQNRLSGRRICLPGRRRSNRWTRPFHIPLPPTSGTLPHLMPVLNFTTGAYRGGLHQADFEITDPYKATYCPAKMMALTAYKLLETGAPRQRSSEPPSVRPEQAGVSGLYRGKDPEITKTGAFRSRFYTFRSYYFPTPSTSLSRLNRRWLRRPVLSASAPRRLF